jgi:hypothetical protein
MNDAQIQIIKSIARYDEDARCSHSFPTIVWGWAWGEASVALGEEESKRLVFTSKVPSSRAEGSILTK